MKLTIFFALLAVSSADYTCLTTKDKPGNCDGASPANTKDMKTNTGETFVTFGMTMCCRPGSGGSPQMQGFNCMCKDVSPGSCVDDYSGAILSKAGQNCAEMIANGGGKPGACDKPVQDVSSAENKKKAEDAKKDPKATKAALDVTVGANVACAFSCGTCKCADDADGLMAANVKSCESDPECKASSKGATDCKSAVAKFGCTKLLNEVNAKIPDLGLKVQDICPESCGFCKDGKHVSEVKSLNAEGAISSENSSTSAVVIVGASLAGVVAVVGALVVKARRSSGVEVPSMTPTLAQL